MTRFFERHRIFDFYFVVTLAAALLGFSGLAGDSRVLQKIERVIGWDR